MRKFYIFLALASLFTLSGVLSAHAQSVLNPDDPIVDYDPANPPPTPPRGVIAKWVRTPRLSWNTSAWKAYYYNNTCFRLLFPKSYKTNPDKKYPMLIFFHGLGELGDIYDNELQLYNCGKKITDSVLNGTFDAFVLFPQTQTKYWINYFSNIRDIINYMAANNRLDKNRISVSGLSLGGSATWDFTIANPDIVAAAIPMSASSASQANTTVTGKIQDIPVWLSQGGKDQDPPQSTSDYVVDYMRNTGMDIRYTVYPNLGHNTWDSHYSEPDAFQYMLRANKTNPHVYFVRNEFCPGTQINVKLGVAAGFEAYEWSKNGVVIPGANSNTLMVSDTGVFAARYKRDGAWTYWSPMPVTISYKETTLTPPIQVSGLMSRVLPAPDGNTTVDLELPEGYASYEWKKVGSSQVLGTERIFTAPGPGDYIARVTELYGCSANYSQPFNVAGSAGPNPPDPAGNVTGFAPSQTSVQLNWSNNLSPANNETAFEVYRSSKTGGPYQLAGFSPADSLGFLDKGLNADTRYYYIVRAIDSTAAAAPSSEISVLTQVDNEAPTAPPGLTVTGSTSNTIGLKWNTSRDNVGISKYEVYINGQKSYVTPDTAFAVYNLTQGQLYSFFVKAVDPSGNLSPASHQVSAPAINNGLSYRAYAGQWDKLPDFSKLAPVATGRIANVDISGYGTAQNYGVVWEGNIRIPKSGTYTFYTNSDDGSKLYIGTAYDPAATALVNNDGLHATTLKSGTTTLTAGTYPITITFFQKGGGAVMEVYWQSAALGMGSKTLIPDSVFKDAYTSAGAPPAVPTGIKAMATAYNKINVSWNDKSNDEAGFEIYRAKGSDGAYQIIYTTSPNITDFVDSTVEPSTIYYYKVQAINPYGASGYDLTSINGLDYSYYEVDNMSKIPDFSILNPVKTGRTSNVTLAVKNRSTNYALKFAGGINIPASGLYTFYTRSDDGSKLYIDGFDEAHLVVNNDYLQGATERSGQVNLAQGIHAIYVTYFQKGWDDVLSVSYAGSGISKRAIPDIAFAGGQSKDTTFPLPPVPNVPDNLQAIALSPGSVRLIWRDNSANETEFKIYRSDGTNTDYRLLKSVPADSIAYTDSALFANTSYYYKIKAVGIGGESAFSSEASVKTLNHLPAIAKISSSHIRFGDTAKIDLIAQDEDNEPLILSVKNLPSFGSLLDYGDGTGLLTFTPSQSQQGLYEGIKVIVTDSHGDRDSTVFDLTVNDNYPPAIQPVSPIRIDAMSSITDTLVAVDQNQDDAVTWQTDELPAFITATPLNRKLALLIAPSAVDTGQFTFRVSVTDSQGELAYTTVSLTVDYIQAEKWYLNFAYQTNASAPWNNIKSVSTTNLKNDQAVATPVGLSLQTTWWKAFDGGAVTGNNSGIYPDNVIKDYYYFGKFGGPNTVNAAVTGLDANKKYSLTFFASSVWSGAADNGHTVFQVGNQVDSIYVQGNHATTLTFYHLKPSANGSIAFTMNKGVDAQVGYLNAMVITREYVSSDPPSTPANLRVSASSGANNEVKVSWLPPALNNADRINIYRSTVRNGVYMQLNTGANGHDTVFLDNTVNSDTTYYYYLVAVNAYGSSRPTDTVSVTVAAPALHLTKWYLSFMNQTSAGSPWNNIRGVNTTGLKNDDGATTTLGLSLQTTWWRTFDGGSVTGNNSGVYPDNVIKDYYYWGIFGGPNPVSGRVTGLDINETYSLTFFSSSSWANVPDNGHTVFQVGSLVDSIYVQGNSTRTLTFHHLTPAADGSIGFTLSKGADAAVGYLNAMVVTKESHLPPAAPTGIHLTNVSGSSNQVRVGWTPPANNNADGINVYRSVDRDGSYTLLNAGAANGRDTSYLDTTVEGDAVYYYYLVAVNDHGNSPSTDTATIMTRPESPVMSLVSDVHSVGGTADTIRVTATVTTGAPISFQLQGAPDFVSLQDKWNGTAYLIIRPVASDFGHYDSLRIIARTATGGEASQYFDIYVTDGGLSSKIYLNFTDASHPYSLPWNNINIARGSAIRYGNLVNGFKEATPVSVTVMNAWSGSAAYGANTYNNSGIYPDGVMSTYYFTSDTVTRNIRVDGLDPAKKYNLVFFASSIFGDNYNYMASYSAGGRTASLNGIRNTNNTARINGLVPNADGSLNVSIKKADGANFALLNAMVIEASDNVIVSPEDLRATAVTTDHVKLRWISRSYNETGFEVWRSSSINGTYTKIGNTGTGLTTYTDNNVAPNTRYFYKVRAKNSTDASAYSNIVSTTTPQFAVYVNFNMKEAPAPSPWNNTQKVPERGDIYGPFFNSQGQNTGIGLIMVSNFAGENNVGVVTGNNSGVYPDLVMQGEYYLDNGFDTVEMKISYLNISMKYDLTFFGSLVNFGWNNTTLFYVNDKVAALTTAYNSTETTTLKDISPDDNGEITVKIIYSSDSRYAILGAMVIQAHSNYDDQGNLVYNHLQMLRMSDNNPLSEHSEDGRLSIYGNVYPNPFDKAVSVKVSSPAADEELILSLYNSNGRLVDQQKKTAHRGLNIIHYQPEAALTPGLYILSVRAESGEVVNVKLIKQ